MPLTINHVLTATTPDNTSYEIRPSAWNSSHALTLSLSGTDISGAFSNQNNVSFGTNPGGYLTASINQPAITGVSAGSTSITTGNIIFSNANGVSFGLSGSTLTGSVGSFVAAPVNVSAGTQSENLGTLVFSNSGNVSFGLNNSTLTAFVNPQSTQPVAVSGSNGSFAFSTLSLGNANNISFLTSNGSVVGSYSSSPLAFSASNGSQTFNTLSFGNSNGLTHYTTNGSIVGIYTVPTQSLQTQAIYIAGNTTGQSSQSTHTVGSLNISGSGVVSVGWSSNSLIISAPNTTGLTQSLYAASNTTQSTSGTASIGSLLFAGAGGVSVGVSNGSVVISGAAGGGGVATGTFYVTGNTTQNSSTALALSSLLFNGLGAMTAGFSNGSIQLSAPATSSLSATGLVSISVNGSTISIGAANTVASAYEPFEIFSGTGWSSAAPGSWTVNRIILFDPLTVSNIYFPLSLSAGIASATSQNSSGTERFSYSKGLTVLTRNGFGGSSSQLSYLTTGSFGLTAGMTYSSSSQTYVVSWVTNTTGGTTSFSTTSSSNGWSNYASGAFVIGMPMVTSFSQGEYFFAHGQSSTTGTTGSNAPLMSISALQIVPAIVQINSFGTGTLQTTVSQYYQPFGFGEGVASAMTTNNTYAASVISAATRQWQYMALSNA